jgi:hypothetical protein
VLLAFFCLEALLEILWLWRVNHYTSEVGVKRLDEEKSVLQDEKSSAARLPLPPSFESNQEEVWSLYIVGSICQGTL